MRDAAVDIYAGTRNFLGTLTSKFYFRFKNYYANRSKADRDLLFLLQ